MQTSQTPSSNTQKIRRPVRVLPRELAEKIAAGEVVERPGSVIKELVENSIDAGATEIRIELEEGGRKKLTVIDDGFGIAGDEMLTALERHATSKITELDDLWNLSTMGFRGEALPSIAAISRFTLESRTADELGRSVYLEGGRILRDDRLSAQSAIRAHGTAITVEDLFFNVPARLKFQKSRSGESGHIRELLERVALCNPNIGFQLISEGRKSLTLAKNQSIQERVAKILDIKESEIEETENQFEHITVKAWLDRNGRAPNSRHVFLSVNGRMVRDKLLQQAVLIGLRARMMEGEYPRIFVAVEVPPGEVDVNVHPAKSEVRFQRARDVFQVVHGALERLAKKPTQAFYSPSIEGISETAETTTNVLPAASAVSNTTPDIAPQRQPLPPATPIAQAKLFHSDPIVYKTKTNTPDAEPLAFARAATTAPNQTVEESPGFHRLQYIGQLKNTYLLFQDENGLVLIDQHAAHERVRYEKIKADFEKHGLHPQPLLVSTTIKCKAEDVALALDETESFTKLGFEFEAFGDDCLLLRCIPEGLQANAAADLFRALLEELRSDEQSATLAKSPERLSAKLERMLATAACHSSVRAGQALSATEARELAVQMDRTESSLNCPHGRPASIKLSFGQIEGLFKRG